MTEKGIVELFAGIAGLAQGFVETGSFRIQGLLDNDASVRESFLQNFPGTTYLKRDIRHLSPQKFLDQIGGEKPFIVMGCPPCQGLSAAGTRDPNDPRNNLIQDFLRFLSYIEPQVFVLENVPQILSMKTYGGKIDEFAIAKNYTLWKGVLNCALFGLPQSRQRAVVIGFRRSLGIRPVGPVPTHGGSESLFSYVKKRRVAVRERNNFPTALGWIATMPSGYGKVSLDDWGKFAKLPEVTTVADAINDLPSAMEREGGIQLYVQEPQTDYQKMMRAGSQGVTSHVQWGHSGELKSRMGRIKVGAMLYGERSSGRSARYFSQAYGRLHPQGLARTITGNFHNPGCGRFIHYRENRTLTVREAARIQGFGDQFTFCGTLPEQRRQVGNAFPKPLALAVAKAICSQLKITP
jgi:DNA (cytosine-5)-methyltransferase 1